MKENIYQNVRENYQKPPLGLRPRFIVLEDRLQEIRQAIERYMQYNKDEAYEKFPIPHEWIEEYDEIVEKLNEMRGWK
jgi:hypothetical protein